MSPTPGLLHDLLSGIETFVILFFLAANTFYAVQFALALLEVRDRVRRTRGEHRTSLMSARALPRITVIAPAYNEQPTITATANSLLALYYPELEVVIVDDGSTDRTLDVLQNAFDLVPVERLYTADIPTRAVHALFRSRTNPNLLVVRKENGGKSDALNVGLNLASGELVCAIDADTLVEADALQRMIRPFLDDDQVLAAGGTIRLANASTVRAGRVTEARIPRRPLPGYQVVEYTRAFLFGRMGLNRMGGNLIISGAFGLFRRDAITRAGGYLNENVGEDMELVARMRRQAYEAKMPHKVTFIPDPVAWTEAPTTAQVLGQQRDRWHRGLTQAVWLHRGLFLNPRYGRLGMVIFPYFVLIELLAPVVEAIGLLVLSIGLVAGVIDWPFAAAFLLFAYGYGTLLTAATVLLDETVFQHYKRPGDHVWLALWVLTENLGYRQMTVWWRLRGLFTSMLRKGEWGKMERRGLTGTTER